MDKHWNLTLSHVLHLRECVIYWTEICLEETLSQELTEFDNWYKTLPVSISKMIDNQAEKNIDYILSKQG